jgi:outer membrane lipoprotein-sorting protein
MQSRNRQHCFRTGRVPFCIPAGVTLAGMTVPRLFALLVFFAALAFSDATDPLNAVFARIDAAAKSFKGMTADITNTQHTAVVDDNDVRTGTMKLLRVKPGLTRVLVELKGQTVALNGHDVSAYNPTTKVEDVYNLANKQSLVNQFLLLGFGATSDELKSNYTITYAGDEKIGSQPTAHLKLIPKSTETLKALKQADLWFAENGLVVQQKFLYPSGDYKQVTYSNMKIGSILEKDLELKIPKDAIIQKHD